MMQWNRNESKFSKEEKCVSSLVNQYLKQVSVFSIDIGIYVHSFLLSRVAYISRLCISHISAYTAMASSEKSTCATSDMIML